MNDDDVREIPIDIASIYGARTRRGLVNLRIDDRMPTQMTPAKAREIAAMLLECAESAEQDEWIVSFFCEHIGTDLERATQVLADFRQWRDEQREGDDE